MTVDPDKVALGQPQAVAPAPKPVALALLLSAAVIVLLINFWNQSVIDCPVGLGVPQCVRLQPFISNEIAISVITAVLAAFLAIKQIAFSSIAVIGYSSARRREAHAIEVDSVDARYWYVGLISSGTGAALIIDAFYEVAIAGTVNVRVNRSYEAARAAMLAAGLEEYRDFCLWKVSAGAAFPAGERIELFECNDAIREKRITSLDVVLVYQGRMGDRWAKRIACIPDRRPSMG